MTRPLLVAMTAMMLLSTPVLAAHNNPWATATDTVLGKKHDTNQLKSVGTPGEDEMRGVMKREADSKGGARKAGGKGRK